MEVAALISETLSLQVDPSEVEAWILEMGYHAVLDSRFLWSSASQVF